jgi:hypothetical protein
VIPINNSDTAWLIVSDYNQDNSIGYPDCLREDIYNPEVDRWFQEAPISGVGTSGTAFKFVADLTRRHVGCEYTFYVGSAAINGGCNVGDASQGDVVGGRI